ncbi:hypothetical protein Tco_1394434 [Tanacetum coccineum]
MLQARENLMEAIQAFLKKYDQIPPKEKSMDLLLADERFLKIKQAVEEEQNKPETKVSSQYWRPLIYYDDDDDDEESSIPLRFIIFSELPSDPEEDIRLIEKLLNDDSSPTLRKLNSEILCYYPNLFPSPIHFRGSGLQLLNNDYISLPEYESFHVNFYNVPSSPRPPEKPQNDDVYFDIEPDTGVLTTKVVDDISDKSTRELYVHVPNVLPTLPTPISSV